jgi:hypothetical protein
MNNKRDLSISMARANIVVFFIAVPLFVVQLILFGTIRAGKQTQAVENLPVLLIAVVASIAVHELIHGITWVIAGHKVFSMIKFGFQWKTWSPYAHLKEPVEVNAYRAGAFMPGLILGILPYFLSLMTGNPYLLWFGLLNTAGAGGDFLVLWLIRNVKSGSLVEDHPTNAGCYVLEP